MTLNKNWILAVRPKTLFASIAPVILGLAVSFHINKFINFPIALLTLFCALLLQIASNLANDYLDAVKGVDNDSRLGPIRVTSSGLIPMSSMKNALACTLAIAFFLGVYLMYIGGPVIILIGLLSLYFAYGYTGGPFPLSYNGLGEVAAFVFFGPVAVFGTCYLQIHSTSLLSVLAGIGPGFISACILAINNLRDIASDHQSNKKTIAVRFGESFQRSLCIALIICSTVMALYFVFILGFTWAFPTIILPLLFFKTWGQIIYHPIDHKLNLALQRTAQYNLLYCLILSLGMFLKSYLQ